MSIVTVNPSHPEAKFIADCNEYVKGIERVMRFCEIPKPDTPEMERVLALLCAETDDVEKAIWSAPAIETEEGAIAAARVVLASQRSLPRDFLDQAVAAKLAAFVADSKAKSAAAA